MELRNLKTFICVAESGSFSKSALRLNYAQSTITAQIDALEKELGIPLFIRYGKQFSLSTEGNQLLDYAYQLIKLESEACHLFQDTNSPSGLLRIGILESISASKYSEVFTHYLTLYSDVKLEITVATTLQLMSMLEKGDLDLIVTLDIPIINPKFQLLYSQVVPIRFFASTSHPILEQENLYLQNLMNERFLLTERNCNYRQVFEEILSSNHFEIINHLEIGYTQILIDCVIKGLGISLLPEFNLSTVLSHGLVKVLDIPDCQIDLSLQILVLQKQWLSPSKKAFLNLFKDTVST